MRTEFTIEQAARHLRRHNVTVRRAVTGGRLPARRDARGRYLIARADLDAFRAAAKAGLPAGDVDSRAARMVSSAASVATEMEALR